MIPYVFDIEGDGLNATKIHCLSVWDGKKIKSTSNYANMRKFFLEAEWLVGHNIQRWDIPTLERILGIKIKAKKVTDTLSLSWYIKEPEGKKFLHGLEAYGERYRLPKVQIADWENQSLKDYIARCERDVEINVKLWNDQWRFLNNLYGSEEEVHRLLDYLQFKMDCAALQEDSRWRLDVPKCEKGLAKLYQDKEEKVAILTQIMPKVAKYSTKNRPKVMYKQNGQLSSHGEKWFELLKEMNLPENTQEVKVISKYDEPNPNSHDQIKDYLFSLGWKPDEYKVLKEEDGSTRKIPQVNTKKPGEVGATESVKRLFVKEPRLEALDGLFVISHRIGILKGFLENMDKEGYIKAEVQGLTNTLRFKHAVAVNLPTPAKPYGELIRGCLIAPEGYELCGADMSSLEDRNKQHFMWPHDPEYVKQMMADDFDPHTNLAVFAGAMTKQQEDQYKSPDCPYELKKVLKVVRGTYKTTNYACQYGAGGPKIAESAGLPVSEGYKLHEAYWKLNWSIKAVADSLTVKMCGGSKWLFNPVSKFWYSLRSDKDRFSTLCQGTGVYCFDTWLKHILKRRRQLTAQFHDEGVWCIKKGFREQCKALMKAAIDDTNEELKLNRQLDIDVQFGDSYAGIH